MPKLAWRKMSICMEEMFLQKHILQLFRPETLGHFTFSTCLISVPLSELHHRNLQTSTKMRMPLVRWYGNLPGFLHIALCSLDFLLVPTFRRHFSPDRPVLFNRPFRSFAAAGAPKLRAMALTNFLITLSTRLSILYLLRAQRVCVLWLWMLAVTLVTQ